MSPHRSWEILDAASYSQIKNSIREFLRMSNFVGVIHPQSLVQKLQTRPNIFTIFTQTCWNIPARIRERVKWNPSLDFPQFQDVSTADRAVIASV